MPKAILEVKNLSVSAAGEPILHNVNLTIYPGETHVLMGPNGAGKSTLMNVLMGSPEYKVESGEILVDGEDLTHATVDARARAGLFMSFQSPEEVPGITLEDFLRASKAAITGKPLKIFAFQKELHKQMEALDMDPSYAQRSLNVGFSGGEKKKSEILQMLMLQPKLALLDETDSGLDVDAVKVVSQGIRQYKNDKNALLIITHNAKILEDLTVDYVHVLVDGAILRNGGAELVDEITNEGFRPLEEGGQA